jgi:hypothetical protein
MRPLLEKTTLKPVAVLRTESLYLLFSWEKRMEGWVVKAAKFATCILGIATSILTETVLQICSFFKGSVSSDEICPEVEWLKRPRLEPSLGTKSFKL